MLVQDNTQIKPKLVKASVGQTIQFSCNSWYDNRWFHNVLSTNHITPSSQFYLFRIESTTYKHGGHYYCYGQYGIKQKHFIARAELRIYGEYCLIASVVANEH